MTDGSASQQRARDATASRRALLDAASELFDERGFDGATTREIGLRAGVDPALIARYFGHKAGLFLAVLADDRYASTLRPPTPEPMAVAERLLSRWSERGRTPVARALADPEPSDDVRTALRRVLESRTLEPLAAALAREGADLPRLRAELLVAMMLGVAISRANGTLSEVARASDEELLEILGPAVRMLTRKSL